MDPLAIFGAVAVTTMMLFYAFENRHRAFVLAFACACVASSASPGVFGMEVWLVR